MKHPERIRTLAAVYAELVALMHGGQYADDEEYRQLSCQRTLTHAELARLTGLTNRKAMSGTVARYWRVKPALAEG